MDEITAKVLHDMLGDLVIKSREYYAFENSIDTKDFDFDLLLNLLYDSGYAEPYYNTIDNMSIKYIRITPLGNVFYNNGGYITKYEQEQTAIKAFKATEQALTTSQSALWWTKLNTYLVIASIIIPVLMAITCNKPVENSSVSQNFNKQQCR